MSERVNLLPLTEEEAVLLDALLKYATVRVKPPMDMTDSEKKDVERVAAMVVAVAPNEVMGSLANKLGAVLMPLLLTVRHEVVDKWREAWH